MCPFAVDDARLRDTIPGQERAQGKPILTSLDPHKPPVVSIPHGEFPRAVYKHPTQEFVEIEHRNTRHELVDVERVPTEHLAKIVTCAEHEGNQGPIVKCAKCEEALAQALEDGWVLEPYIPKAPPKVNAGLYDAKPKRKQS